MSPQNYYNQCSSILKTYQPPLFPSSSSPSTHSLFFSLRILLLLLLRSNGKHSYPPVRRKIIWLPHVWVNGSVRSQVVHQATRKTELQLSMGCLHAQHWRGGKKKGESEGVIFFFQSLSIPLHTPTDSSLSLPSIVLLQSSFFFFKYTTSPQRLNRERTKFSKIEELHM